MRFKNREIVKILMTGGGTIGSVTPLLALVDTIKLNKEKEVNAEFLWIGTKTGLEKEMIRREKLEFKSIKCGKLRRYFSFKNFVDPIFVIYGFFESLFIIKKWKPGVVVSAGGFVSVPVVWAAFIMRVPILIHQQDARAGLANRLMSLFASVITVTFEKSLKDYGKKAVWTGNPLRNKLMDFKIDRRTALQKLGLYSRLPVVLILGGGTGAEAINNLVKESLGELIKFAQVLHITGKGKGIEVKDEKNYHQFDFLHIEGMAKVFTAADIVVSRAGMGVLTELSFLAKPAILIPIPDSHQEDNAQAFKDNDAAIVLNQNNLTNNQFVGIVRGLLFDADLKNKCKINIKNVIKEANTEMLNIIKNIAI